MSRLLFILFAIVAVALAIIAITPGVIPVSAYKGRIEAAASEAAGREITISDNLSFRVFPRTAFHVEDLAIANAEGFEGDYFAEVRQADIGVKLFPLISGVVEVDRFVLVEPDINLARATDGAVNWSFAADIRDEESGGRDVNDVRLGDVRIVDGRARYADAAAGRQYDAQDIDVNIILKSFAEPLEVKGEMVFQGEPSEIDIVLTTLDSLRRKAPSNLKFDMTIGETAAGADLTVETDDDLRYRGPLDLHAPDLPALAALAGAKLADAPGFDRLSLSGDVDGGKTSFRLTSARIGFDDINAQGVLNLDWSGTRPKASGILSTEKLDLRPYMPPPAESESGFPAWSEQSIDFKSLGNMEADFDISTDAIFLNDLVFGESRLKLHVENARLTADIPELQMYSGQGSGRIVVNARGGAPAMAGNFDVSAVDAEPFSLDLLKHDNLIGLGSLHFSFTATGASQADIMASLDGEGGFDIADGALKGVNIPKIARALAAFKEGFNPPALQAAVNAARGPRERTDFSEFLSEFTITDGLVNAPTITLNGPFVTMKGAGAVNLPAQTIDLRLSPTAATTADGEGGRSITIPMRVGGTFSKPTLGIDAEAFVRTGVERTLLDVLRKAGSREQDDNAAGESGAAPSKEEQTPGDDALRAFEQILVGPQEREETGDGEAGEQDATPQENQPTPEEALVNQGLGLIFGPGEEPPAAENQDQPKDE